MQPKITQNTAVRAFEELLLALARDEDSRLAILDVFPSPDLLPPAYAAVWRAALDLLDNNQPITPNGLAAAAGQNADRFAFLENGVPYEGAELLQQIDVVREIGSTYQGNALLTEAKRILVSAGMEAMIQYVVDRGTQVVVDGKKRDPGGEAIVYESDAMRDDERVPGLMSGLPWLDKLTNGFTAGDGDTLAGIYKGRKSTTKRNIALALLSQGHRVALFEYEASRIEVMNDFYAMIGNLYLHATGREGLATLTRRYLMQTQHFKPEHWEALQVARRMMLELSADHRLVIFDRKDKIRDQHAVGMKIRRCSLLYGTQVVFIDGGTNIDWRDGATGKTISEAEDRARSGAAGDWLAETADQTNTAIVMLWQYRESENTFTQGAGLMGGSALAADADFLMESKYDEDADDAHIYFKMRRSRHSAAGWKSETKIKIDVPSGVMLGYYMRTSKDAWDATLREMWIVPREMFLRDWKAPAGVQAAGLVPEDDLDEMLEVR